MARTYTPMDISPVLRLMIKELTGQDATIQGINVSNFVSVGELVNTYPKENVYNALSIPLLRSLIAARSEEEELLMINSVNSGVYANRMRKISYLSRLPLNDGAFNTNLFTNLAPGFTAGQNPDAGGTPQSTKSQWEQNPTIPKELHFGGSSVWDHALTWYKYQDKVAFESPEAFARFWRGALIENANEIKREKSSFRRLALLNFLAGIYDLRLYGPVVVNLTAAYNTKFGTSYTSAQLRTTYCKEFLAFFVSEFKKYQRIIKKASVNYHVDITETIGSDTFHLLRHTPYSRQRVILYEPLFIESEALVLPEIFNPEYLDIKTQYTGLMWWQNENNPSAISVTPAIPDFGTGTQIQGNPVALDYVVGVLYDEDALMTDFQLDDVDTTPLESRKKFRNTWYTMARNAINDFTEKCILFTMEDPAGLGSKKKND